jgi:hypothetical protein
MPATFHAWISSTSSRLAEASWVSFVPGKAGDSEHHSLVGLTNYSNGWRLNNMGSAVDPTGLNPRTHPSHLSLAPLLTPIPHPSRFILLIAFLSHPLSHPLSLFLTCYSPYTLPALVLPRCCCPRCSPPALTRARRDRGLCGSRRRPQDRVPRCTDRERRAALTLPHTRRYRQRYTEGVGARGVALERTEQHLVSYLTLLLDLLGLLGLLGVVLIHFLRSPPAHFSSDLLPNHPQERQFPAVVSFRGCVWIWRTGSLPRSERSFSFHARVVKACRCTALSTLRAGGRALRAGGRA